MNKFKKRLGALFHRRQLDRDLEDELAFHLAMSEQQGADPASARRRFGNTAALQEKCRELWAFTAVEAWWQDVRFALRTIGNSPLVTATAVVALGLGIGANTTVFTIVSSALKFDMAVDRIERRRKLFEIDQPFDAVTFCEARKQAFAMLEDATAQVICHAGIERAVRPTGPDVNVKDTFEAHARLSPGRPSRDKPSPVIMDRPN